MNHAFLQIPYGQLIQNGLTVEFIALYALFLGILLAWTIIFATICNRFFSLPIVAGQLIAGILLGPSLVDIASWKLFSHPIQLGDVNQSVGFKIISSDFFIFTTILVSSVLIVAYLLWMAGYETDIEETIKVGTTATLGGLLGAVFPIVGLASFCIGIKFCTLVQAIAFGLIFAATSVSIPIALLIATKRMQLRSSKVTLGAAVIDDILAVILVSIFFVALQSGILGMTTSALTAHHGSFIRSVSSLIGICFALLGFGYFIIAPCLRWLAAHGYGYLIAPASTVIMLFYFAAAELLGGLAGITGAYFAGIVVRLGDTNHYAYKAMSSFINIILLPIFLGSIGLQVNIAQLGIYDWLIVFFMLIIAIFTKLAGCYVAAMVVNFTSTTNWKLHEIYLFGSSMVARGEVGLVVASLMYSSQLITEQQYAIAIVVIVLSTIAAPIMLAIGFAQEYRIESKEVMSYNLGEFSVIGTTALFNALISFINTQGMSTSTAQINEGKTVLSIAGEDIKAVLEVGKGISIEGKRQSVLELIKGFYDSLYDQLEPIKKIGE